MTQSYNWEALEPMGSLFDRRTLIAIACMASSFPIGLAAVGVVPALTAMAAFFETRGYSTLFVQLVAACPAAIMVVTSPLYSFVLPAFGQRTFIVLCLGLYVAGGTAGIYLSDPVLLVISRLILGIAVGGLLVGILSVIGNNFTGLARDKLLGAVSAVGGLSSICALAFGGMVVDAFGWRSVFYFYLIALFIIPMAYTGLPKERNVASSSDDRKKHGWAVRGVLPLYVLVCMLVVGQFMQFSQLPFLLENKGFDSATTQGLLIAGTAAAASLGAALYGFARRVFSAHHVVLFVTITFGLCIVVTEYTSNIWAIGAACVAMGYAMGNVEPVAASVIFGRVVAASQARAMGFLISALYLGQFLNPVLFDPIRRNIGLEEAFRTVGYGFLTLALVVFLFPRFFALTVAVRPRAKFEGAEKLLRPEMN